MIYKVGDILQKEGMLDFHFEGMIGDIVFGYFQRPNGIKESDHYHIDELQDWTRITTGVARTVGERWKPEKGNYYYAVVSKGVDGYVWENDEIDNDSYIFGNCFQTRKQAQAAADKVKELLLSLHEEV